MFFLLQYLRAMQILTKDEIDETSVTAQEFSVEIWALPDHTNWRLLKAEIWSHIESVNTKEKERALHPVNQIPDDNQDNVMSINFGLSDYGRLNYMMKITDLVKEKKKIEKLSLVAGVSQKEKVSLEAKLAKNDI